jgi:ElaB/YqjD/DUF883 family membrane-anchored ribosome-binding protein
MNATGTIKDQIEPMLDTVETKARQARRAIARGRHGAEDFVAGTTLRVRRHPLQAVAVATLAGALAGSLVGLTLGWQAGSRRA